MHLKYFFLRLTKASQVLFLLIFNISYFTVLSYSQENNENVVEAYIAQYKDIAIREMIRTKVPASVKLAQGILESGSGQSTLSLTSNNHFGVKCKKNWTGETVYFDDDEKNECFRKYENAEDSYKDQSDFLLRNPRYAFLFELDPLDYKGWCKGLKKAGYATNDKYTTRLITLIEKYNLQQYSLEALKDENKISDQEYTKYIESIKPKVKEPVIPVSPTKIAKEEAKEERRIKTHKETTVEDIRNKTKSGYSETFKKTDSFLFIEINLSKAMIVTKGTSLFALAVKYNIDYGDFLKINDLYNVNDIIKENQIIYIKRKKKRSYSADYHVTEKGTTLREISQIEGVQLKSLIKLNPAVSSTKVLDENKIILLR